MQQVDIVQSRMSLRCSRGKCYYILAPSCAHSLLEKKVNIIFFFFQSLVYAHNQMYKCRLLINFENSSGPTKCSRENACMCRLVSAFAAGEKKCSVSFSAPICVLNHLLLVSSADNLFKQLGPTSDQEKLSCENGAHVMSSMSLRCWRGKFVFFWCAFLFFNFLSYFIALSFLTGIRLC